MNVKYTESPPPTNTFGQLVPGDVFELASRPPGGDRFLKIDSGAIIGGYTRRDAPKANAMWLFPGSSSGWINPWTPCHFPDHSAVFKVGSIEVTR